MTWYEIAGWGALGTIFLVPAAYLAVRSGAIAWFRTRNEYDRYRHHHNGDN